MKVDPLGRCAAVLVYGLQMIVLKAAEVLLLICRNSVTVFSIYLRNWYIIMNCLAGWGWRTFKYVDYVARLMLWPAAAFER